MNKKIIMMLAMLAGAMAAKAQTEKGRQLLGGNISANYTKSSQTETGYSQNGYVQYATKTTSFSIGPTYSYFIANNIDLGVSLGYSQQKNSYDDLVTNTTYQLPVNDDKLHSFFGSVYLRKYFLYNQKVGFRTGPFVQYELSKRTNYYPPVVITNDAYRVEDKIFSGGLRFDFVYFPTSRIGLAAALGSLAYTHSNSEQNTRRYKSDNIGLNLFTNGLSLSVMYALGK